MRVAVIDMRIPQRAGGGYDTAVCRDVAVSGNYAYVADDSAGLQ